MLLPLLASSQPTVPCPRSVDEINQEAFEEAHQRDGTAIRALSATTIKTSSDECLSVNLLSGDFRANMNPLDIVPCGSTDGEEWDVITSGVHNDRQGTALLVNTLTQACVSFDASREEGDQVIMFSCGGRADGDGEVTDSQLFVFDGEAGPLSLKPENGEGMLCLVASGDRVDIATCEEGDDALLFTFGDGEDEAEGADLKKTKKDMKDIEDDVANGNVGDDEDVDASKAFPLEPETSAPPTETSAAPEEADVDEQDFPVTESSVFPEESIPVTESSAFPEETEAVSEAPEAPEVTEAPVAEENDNGEILTVNPTEPVPVSKRGDLLNPARAARAHKVHPEDMRVFESVHIVTSDGRCLFVNPTAGDFRQNLIPVQVVDCAGSPNEKFDLITQGVHNNQEGTTLLVSSLTGGCVRFNNRRDEGDQVSIFSCGGQAAGRKCSSFLFYPKVTMLTNDKRAKPQLVSSSTLPKATRR